MLVEMKGLTFRKRWDVQTLGIENTAKATTCRMGMSGTWNPSYVGRAALAYCCTKSGSVRISLIYLF